MNKLLVMFLIIVAIIAVSWIVFRKDPEPSLARPKKMERTRAFNRLDIWKKCLERYGETETLKVFPKSYKWPEDAAKFKAEYSPYKEYIAKEYNSGERKGVFLVNRTNMEVLNNKKIVQVQEYLENPLLVNGFKFGMRYFMVVDCDKGMYLYRTGYNVFADKRFEYNGLDRGMKINQSMGGDKHYDTYDLPRLTTQLATCGVDSDLLAEEVGEKLRMIIESCGSPCGEGDAGKSKIFGVDVELLDDRSSRIIEINSSPTTTFDIEWKNGLTDLIKRSMKEKKYVATDWISLSN